MAVTFVPATGSVKYVPYRLLTVIEFDAAKVWAAKLFMRTAATVPVLLVSVNVAALCTNPTPEVVQAATDAPIGARVTRPLTVVVWVAPEVEEPMVIVVVLPDAPLVPMLTVLVLPEEVTPAAMPVVLVATVRVIEALDP